MLSYKTFEVEIERKVATGRLSWPEPGEAGDDSSLGCNRQYMDLRRLTWSEARRVYDVETRIIARLEKAEDSEEELEQIEDELYEEDVDHIYGLDIGVASLVVTLSAARCLPFTSCNAGSFGGSHHESHPLVAFYARWQAVEFVLECAEEAGVGLSNSDRGTLIVYANDIRMMRAFAQAMMRRNAAFRALRLPRVHRGKSNRKHGHPQGVQYKLL